MWTREKSESGRGVWGCVLNLFFFFPSKTAVDVSTDPVDVSVVTSSCKCGEFFFFAHAREFIVEAKFNLLACQRTKQLLQLHPFFVCVRSENQCLYTMCFRVSVQLLCIIHFARKIFSCSWPVYSLYFVLERLLHVKIVKKKVFRACALCVQSISVTIITILFSKVKIVQSVIVLSVSVSEDKTITVIASIFCLREL